MDFADDKKGYFTRLRNLASVDEDELDEDERAWRERARAFFRSASSEELPLPSLYVKRNRASRPSLPEQVAASASPETVIQRTPVANPKRPLHTRAMSNPTIAPDESYVPDTMPRAASTLVVHEPSASINSQPSVMGRSPSLTSGKKRKRVDKDEAAPLGHQIFHGLAFFYIPNNAVAPLRKKRIQKAQQHGAAWVRKAEDATHLVVDKELNFDDIQKVIKLSGLDASPLVVNEDYPLDCIHWNQLLSTHQTKYQVTGCPLMQPTLDKSVTNERVSRQPASSPQSLPLKQRADNSTNAAQGDTPPRGDERNDEGGDETGLGLSLIQFTGSNISQASSDPAPDGPMAESSRGHDELLECIELAKEYHSSGLGTAMDETLNESSSDYEDDSQDNETAGVTIGGSKDTRPRAEQTGHGRDHGRKKITWEERLVCHKGGTLGSTELAQNPNVKTIEALQALCGYYERTGNHWRHTAYRRAITVLKRQSVKITTLEQANKLPQVGERLAKKIVEIVETKRLAKLEYVKNDPHIRTLELFMGVYDVGNARAQKWMEMGYKTLEDLRDKADLTPNQRVGVEHYDDLNSRIPRAEMDKLSEYVRNEAAKIDPNVELVVGGSYRRGSPSSGDIDFIVTKKGSSSVGALVPFLQQLVGELLRQGFLTATLAALHADRSGKEGPGSQWHGCCVLPRVPGGFNDNDSYQPVWRRIDFLLVPETEYGAALIYFTGNDIFNRSMRLLASRKGMKLNQRGLFKSATSRKRPGEPAGQLLEGKDEKRIFELLGVKWRPPSERWC